MPPTSVFEIDQSTTSFDCFSIKQLLYCVVSVCMSVICQATKQCTVLIICLHEINLLPYQMVDCLIDSQTRDVLVWLPVDQSTIWCGYQATCLLTISVMSARLSNNLCLPESHCPMAHLPVSLHINVCLIVPSILLV